VSRVGQTSRSAPAPPTSIGPGALVTLPAILESNARDAPTRCCAVFEDAIHWTWADAVEQMRRGADVLASCGVHRGQRVLLMLDNGPQWLRAWSAIASLGAVTVPVNTAFLGGVLAQLAKRSAATFTVTNDLYLRRILEVAPEMSHVDAGELALGSPHRRTLNPPLAGWDLNAIMFTSGTTGQAKGVVTPWLQTYMGGWPIFGIGAGLGPEDRWLIDLPLFHVGGQQALLAAFASGASVAVRERFTSGGYWQTTKEAGVTRSMIVSSMLSMLIGQPPSPSDRDHAVRSMVICPAVTGQMTEFRRRFAVDEIRTALGSTETGAPIMGLVEGEPKQGWVGHPREGVDVLIVDDHDAAVPDGEVGQLLLRTARPWEMMSEYLGDPEATRAVWRHGWFHTGDAVRLDGASGIYWVDRIKDTIRRRGENISSVEIERALLKHPAVEEAACVPVPDELGDEEVKAWIVLKGGHNIEYSSLVRFLADRLPYFMVPRYYELIDALPKTVTMRVQKIGLRQAIPGPAAWDRVTAGIQVTRFGVHESGQVAGQR
jgi:carnitine-CoA ligase